MGILKIPDFNYRGDNEGVGPISTVNQKRGRRWSRRGVFEAGVDAFQFWVLRRMLAGSIA